MNITADFISSVAGILLSLVFSYIPGLNTAFAKLDTGKQRLIMLASLVVVSLALVGISCAGFAKDLGIALTCDRSGFVLVAQAFVFSLIANQAAYSITPQAPKVKEIKSKK